MKNLQVELKYRGGKMGQIIFKVLGLLLLMNGVIMIYDARILTKKWFGFGDQNEATLGFKLLGLIICVIGGIMVYFNK